MKHINPFLKVKTRAGVLYVFCMLCALLPCPLEGMNLKLLCHVAINEKTTTTDIHFILFVLFPAATLYTVLIPVNVTGAMFP